MLQKGASGLSQPKLKSKENSYLQKMPHKATREEVLTAQLNAITFEDINRMDYSKLNQAGDKKDYFDPKQLIDLDSDDEESLQNGSITPQKIGKK